MSISTYRPLVVSLLVLLGFVIGHAQQPYSTEPIVLKSEFVRHQISPNAVSQPLTLTGLKKGETYRLIISAKSDVANCVPTISMGQVESSTSGAEGISFEATASTMSFHLQFPCTWQSGNVPSFTVTIQCTSCSLIQNLFSGAEAPIAVEGMGADEAVRDVLIGGDCFDVTNITFCGGGDQIGAFSDGQTNIGINRGVILATGPISIALGPNNADGAGGSSGGCGTDGDLVPLSSGAQNDNARLEFDFTPTQPQVTFEYVFASEEYCEYVGSQFNDVFGFFITGPGIPGGTQNLAVIPMTATPVAINNINHISFPGFFVNNQPASSGDLCGQTPSSSPVVQEVQYDGFTRRFVAVANVIPCQTYHIKLSISDIGDGAFDSAVFLREGSFDAGGNASVEWLVNDEPADETIEKCNTVSLLFDRVGGNLNVPLNVSYTITGTATSGVDFAPIPGSIVIPAGASQFVLPVNIFGDAILEGQESIIITLTSLCSCAKPQEILLINDLPLLSTQPDTVVSCGTGFISLEATFEGGVPDHTFNWSNNGGTGQQAIFFVQVSGTYRVTITDACGQTIVQNIFVRITPPPKAQLLPPAPQLCANGGTGVLTINFIGDGPFEFVYSINGVNQPPVTNVETNPFQLVISQIGTYQLVSVTDVAGCQGIGQGSQLVVASQLNLTGVATGVQCFGQTNGTINTTVTGGQGPYTYQWAGPQTIPSIADPINLQAGVYTVTVTDGYTCSMTNTYNVQATSVLLPVATQGQTPNCYNPTGGSINLAVSGGTPNYTFSWSNTTTLQNPQNLGPGTYTVTITDQAGCSRTTTATVVANNTPPAAAGVAMNGLDCQVLTATLNGQGSEVGNNITYLWAPVGPGNITGSPNTLTTTVNQGGTYRLRVTNTTNGCTSTVDVPVAVNNTPPIAEAGLPQTLSCAITNVTLDGTGSSSSANNITYLWSASNGGVIAGGGNTTQPIVSEPGTYTILVTNLINHCTATDQVVVTENIVAPTAAVAPAGIINCANNQVTLNAGASSPSNVLFSWYTLNGNIISGNASANPVVSEAGTYTVTVTNPGNGCTNTASVDVGEDQSVPQVLAFSNDQLNCNNATVTVTGQNPSNDGSPVWTASSGGNIVSGANTFSIVVNQPGLYTLTVTNPVSQCSASASKLIDQDITPPPAVVGPPATLNCYNNNVLTIGDATAIPFNTNFQWTTSAGGSIQGAVNQSTAVVNAPGTYTLRVTNTLNGCTNVASVAIAQDITPPTAQVAPAGQIDCNNSFVQLSGAGSSAGPVYSYEWSTPNGSISVGGMTLNPVVTSAGIYALKVTNSVNGCTSTANATVISDLNLPNFSIQPASPITCTIDQQTLNASVQSTGNFAYQWGTIDGVILGGANSLTPLIGNPGTYTLIVTNQANNCSAVENVVVPANNVAPTISAGANQILNCTTPTLTLNGTAPTATHTYQWTAANGGEIVSGANTLTPLINAAGDYTLLVTNVANGCTSTSVVQIAQDAGQPVVQIAAPQTLTCTVQQVTLNASGSSVGANFVYDWAGQGISNGANSLNPTVDQPGPYTVTITNTTNGCTTVGTVNVPENTDKPVADAGPNATLNCYNAQLQLGGSTISTGPQFIYDWTGPGIISGGNNALPIVNQPGNYDVTVTNTTNGCTEVGSVFLDADFNTPGVDAGPNGVITCTDNFFATTPAVTGTGTFTYHWETTGGSFLNANGPNELNPLLNGAGYYYLTVTNTVSGCTSTDQLQVLQSADFPNADAGQPEVITCYVPQVTLDAGNSSQGGPFVYQWIPIAGGNIVSGANTLNPVVDEPGTYSLAVRDTSNSCISYSSVIVGENIVQPDVDAGLPVTLTCSVSAVVLSGTVNSNGNFTYGWTASGGGNILSGFNSPNPNVNAVGVYTLTVTNLLNGCTDVDQVQVLADVNAPVVTIAQPDTLSCIVKEIVLNTAGSSVGNVTYSWVTPNGNFVSMADSSNVVVNAPGVYQLLIQNLDNNCSSLAAVSVAQDIANPMALAGSDMKLDCSTLIATLDGAGSSSNGNYFYQWTTPNGAILADANSLTPTVTAAGSYLLTVLNTDNGCKSTDVAVVTQDINAPNIVIVIPAVITCFSPEVVLDGSNSSNGANFTYAWTTPDGNIVNGENDLQAVVNAPGSYTLTVFNNNNGCSTNNTTLVDENTVAPSVQILPPGTLTCANPIVDIIALAEGGTQYVFGWSTTDGNIVGGETSLKVNVNEPGVYSVLVVNNNNGCATLEQTEVIEITDQPKDFVYTLELPGCKDNDGYIRFDSVDGGIGPFLYSVNGGNSFSTSVAFGSLPPGEYLLLVQDANGCEYSEELDVPEAIDPAIDLLPQVQLELGDSLQVNATLPPGFPLDLIDTIRWDPMLYLQFNGNSIEDLLTPTILPFNTIQYKVSILTKNGGCEASDRLLVLVNNEPKIYIPNVFTPEDPSQGNHIFMIYSEDTRKQIKQVNTFQIFDRWGEKVHQATNFQPNDPAHGWNGKIGGTSKLLTPAVFVYYAEIELIDGRKLLYEGDVTLVR